MAGGRASSKGDCGWDQEGEPSNPGSCPLAANFQLENSSQAIPLLTIHSKLLPQPTFVFMSQLEGRLGASLWQATEDSSHPDPTSYFLRYIFT